MMNARLFDRRKLQDQVILWREKHISERYFILLLSLSIGVTMALLAALLKFIIHHIELTGATALEITDFATPDEKADAIELWDTQVAELRRTLGI